jgi:hypothetical protein
MLEYNPHVHTRGVDLEIMTRTFADLEANIPPVCFFVSLKKYAIALERRTNRVHRLRGKGRHFRGNQRAGVLWLVGGEEVNSQW